MVHFRVGWCQSLRRVVEQTSQAIKHQDRNYCAMSAPWQRSRPAVRSFESDTNEGHSRLGVEGSLWASFPPLFQKVSRIE